MSNPNFTTLTVTSGSTLTGGANITGTCNTNNINILNNGNFIQNGSGSLTTGSGNFYLNGPMIGTGQTATLGTITCNTLTSGQINANNSLFIGNAGFLQLPSNKQITSSNDVVDTANTQTISGAKTFSSQIIANGGINAGSNSITCGSLTCSSENDTGALTVTGALNANGGIVTNNAGINAGSGTLQAGSIKSQVVSGTYTGVNSYFFTNGDVYGTTYFDNPQSNSSINFRIGTSLPTIATVNTSGLSINGTITSNNNNITAGTGTITCGTLNCSSINDTGALTVKPSISLLGTTSTSSNYSQVSTLYDGTNYNTYYDNYQNTANHIFRIANGSGGFNPIFNLSNSGVSTNNYSINTGTGTITCSSITCGSETDTGTLTVGGLLTANNGISIANNKSISTGDSGGALLFTGLGFSSTYAPTTGYGLGLTMNQYANGEVSLFSLRNNPSISGGFSFFDYYTTTPTKTLLATLNSSTGLATNNLPINAGTGAITCGSLGVTKNTTGTGTYNTLASFYDSNTSLGSQPQIAVGNSSSLSNVFGYSYVGSASPYGFLGLAGAGSNQLCYDSNGFYIGSVQKPPNSGTYKLQVDGATNLNGTLAVGITTVYGSVTSSTGTTASSNTIAYQTSGATGATQLQIINNASNGSLNFVTGFAGDVMLIGTNTTPANSAITIACNSTGVSTSGGIRITQTATQIGAQNGLSTTNIYGPTNIYGTIANANMSLFSASIVL